MKRLTSSASAEQSDPRLALLEVLYEHFPIITFGNLILAIANLIAYGKKLPLTGLTAYAGAIAMLIALRLSMLFYYRRQAISEESARRHLILIQLLSLINGLVWGTWSWYVSALLPPDELLAMVVIQAGICAGVVSTSSASRLGLGLFVVTALTPLSVHQILFGGDDKIVVASVIFLYLLLVLASSNRIYKTIYNSIELAHKNSVLADQLYHFSNTDGLTGIANRRHLDSSLEKATSLYKRHALEFSILLIDVDDFKLFNDSKGHIAGDACLKIIARTAREVFTRKEDLVARYGGEEFVVLLPGLTTDQAMELADTYRQRVFDLNLPHERSKSFSRVTVSIGVADGGDQRGLSPERLLETADRALYQAKLSGKNRVCRIEK